MSSRRAPAPRTSRRLAARPREAGASPNPGRRADCALAAGRLFIPPTGPRRSTMNTPTEPAIAGVELKNLLSALLALKKGETGVRLPVEWVGVAGKVADAFNEVVELNERMARELSRLSRVVGKEG